jgi:hypothetical protein
MKRQQRQAIRDNNTKTLDALGLNYELRNNGAVILLREYGKPKADYYPGTNKWKVIRGDHERDNIYKTGDINAFIDWYQQIEV